MTKNPESSTSAPGAERATVVAGRKHETKQLLVVHLSDVHFGAKHRFSPPSGVRTGNIPRAGYPTLLETLVRDMQGPDPHCPIIVCITGDLVETGHDEQFGEVAKFIERLATKSVFGRTLTKKNIFVIPGNHDPEFADAEAKNRWTNWTNFHNETFGTRLDRRHPYDRVRLYDRTSDLGAIILCLNSAEHVQKDTVETHRGMIDNDQIKQIQDLLAKVPKKKREAAIRIALIHHHPILIPGLAESGAGYDAVENAGFLLSELRKFGFHLVLHGHKHVPFVFSEDSSGGLHEESHPPIVVVAGGSAACTDIPPNARNCYNQLSIKWNPNAKQGRILLQTRGLRTTENGRDLPPVNWRWVALVTDDRQYLGGPRAPETFGAIAKSFSVTEHGADDRSRMQQYADLHCNMPVCEVMPSLMPGQHNEVRLWLEPHKPEYQKPKDLPVAVTWSAGKLNPVITVRREHDPLFCATMHYWGAMLVQAKLHFSSGESAYAYVYARMPTGYQRKTSRPPAADAMPLPVEAAELPPIGDEP